MMPLIISGSIAFAIILLFVGISTQLKGAKSDVRERLKNEGPAVTEEQIYASIRRDTRLSRVDFLNELLASISLIRNLERWTVQARVAARPGDVVIKSIVLASLGFGATYWATGYISSGVIVGGILLVLPVINILRRRRKRFNMFAKQLPDSMTMIKNALRAGHTLNKAMQIVAEEMPDPISVEFRDTVEEMRLGLPISHAMLNMSRRIEDDNLSIFIAAVMIQHEVGGNLTELLENISKTIRERFRLQAEVKSLTAEGRISGIVIAVLPIALAMIISLMQPDFLTPLFKTETGNKLLIAAAISETIGFIWIRKVCKVRF